jgi:hypothetical protein
MFGIGPMELIIVSAIALLMIGGPVIAVVLIVLATRKKSAQPNPNLTPCPDCGRFVSRLTVSCPQCGRPLSPPPN